MTSKCLVSFRDLNVAVKFTGQWTKADLLNNLQQSGVLAGVENESSLSLMVYDEDFGSYVDVVDGFEIPNMAKLKIREASQYRIVDVLDVEVVQAAQVQAPQRGPYVLPVAPQFILAKIASHRQGDHFEHRQQVLQWLHHDLRTYSE